MQEIGCRRPIALSRLSVLLLALGGLAATVAAGGPVIAADPHAPVLLDPTRPVTRISRTGFDLDYFTPVACPTRVQVRRADTPFAAGKLRGVSVDPWSAADVRVADGPPGERTLHRISIEGLEPGARYFYRVFDPGTEPTSQEARWGARTPWRREYGVSTLAPAGRRTLVRYPVKVLLMPNVINVESAVKDVSAPAPHPEKVSPEQLDQVRADLDRAARFFFVNSHMRLWVDFTVLVDDRWQRWGPEVADVDKFYSGWPVCRSYAGKDYEGPGGGRFTTVDSTDPAHVADDPLVEPQLFYGQAEIAFPRRWEPAKKQWVYYTSGGGTTGVDDVPAGITAKSQFFGGYDTAWLTTHEIHHQLESLGAFSLADREDDRIVYNHWAPRSRTRGPDAASGPEGSKGMHAWSTSGRHGEHYDGMAFWDRTLTEAQWLRLYLTQTVLVADADTDGFPDDDPRLPLDEKRFGSRPDAPATDGVMNDRDKAMLSTWAPAPLQAGFAKPRQTFLRPSPTNPDSDGDGWPDGVDPEPLAAEEPFVWPLTAAIDGDAAEWSGIPLGGSMSIDGLEVEFRQAHDDAAYYGLFRARGDWAQVRVVIDPEGLGVYSTDLTQALRILNGEPIKADSRDRFFPRAPGLQWSAKRTDDGWATIEFSLPNAGEGLMYWRGAGREVGTEIEVTDTRGGVRSIHEPYHLFYARMLERPGKSPMPASPPTELRPGQPGVVVLKPGDGSVRLRGDGWRLDDGVYRHQGSGEDALYIGGVRASAFDLWIDVECQSDAILGGYTAGKDGRELSAVNDYVAFVGGYGNTRSRLRLFGVEAGDSDATVTPPGSRHTMQLTRRNGTVWCLWDGKPVLWAADPDPKVVVDRLAALGGYGGNQIIHEIRYRVTTSDNP